MTSLLALIDAKLDPLLQALNKLRQVRDSLPVGFWNIVPAPLREPFEAAFLAVENWDRFVGQMREAGNLPPKASQEQGGMNA